MLTFPIYQLETMLLERSPDGEWDECYPVPITSTLFYPVDDFDGLTEAGFRKIVRHGAEPSRTVVAPDGSQLVEVGRAVYLQTTDGRKHDAINALVFANRGAFGLTLLRRNQRLSDDGSRIEGFLSVEFSAVATGPVVQLSLFGEG